MISTPFNLLDRLKEIDMFLRGTEGVHQKMRRVTAALTNADIPHAVLGGMACNAHRCRRTTGDVDVLLTPEGFDEFCRRFVPGEFDSLAGRPRCFLDRATEMIIDVRMTDRFPGGRPESIAFPDPARVAEMSDAVAVVNLVTLIELKLAEGRSRDLGDVVELILFNDLDESFAERLHESVRGDYVECLDEKRREDEYENVQDRSFEGMLRGRNEEGESAS